MSNREVWDQKSLLHLSTRENGLFLLEHFPFLFVARVFSHRLLLRIVLLWRLFLGDEMRVGSERPDIPRVL
jgi:hypothetical protein